MLDQHLKTKAKAFKNMNNIKTTFGQDTVLRSRPWS